MKDASMVDKNLIVKSEIKKDGIRFYDVTKPPFKLYGIMYDGESFKRMPQKIAENVSDAVVLLNRNTAGGRVRFKTNSLYIVVHSKGEMGKLPHMAFVGAAGFDLYVGTRFVSSFVPPSNKTDGYESIIEFSNSEMREVTINFPLYSAVDEFYIGLDEKACVEVPEDYKIIKPVVFYGSSITQGGCASRPGTCYQGHITRRFDCDYINLGFSGNAKAEDAIAEYIASLDMSLFVYDYDHNAPTLEHLENTHERMFKRIRQKNPTLPVIMMSRPKFYLTPDEEKRLEIVKKTYQNAVAAGDKNVYFIDGRTLCALCQNEGTVDNCHPTDFGFASMAKTLGDFIEENNLL